MTNATMPWAEPSAEDAISLGAYVRVSRIGDVVVIWAGDVPICRLARQDRAALRETLAGLATVGVISQSVVARSGLVAEATFHRDCAAYRRGGGRAVLDRTMRGSKGPRRLVANVVKEIERLTKVGCGRREVAQRLGLGLGSVQRALTKASAVGAMQMALPIPSTPGCDRAGATDGCAEAVSVALSDNVAVAACGEDAGGAVESDQADEHVPAGLVDDRGGVDERADHREMLPVPAASELRVPYRALTAEAVQAQRASEWVAARMGWIEEQSALFPPVEQARYAGVMLALALVSATGLLAAVRKTIGRLKNGFYGVRSMVTTLFAMAMLRCRRPEQLKGFDPSALGAVLGLARAPEMKTVRRKVAALASDESHAVALVTEIARRHAERAGDALAYLYVDGHVRAYFGKVELGKAHHTAMRISLPATTDYWVSDATGAPVLVVISEGNAALTQMMPSLLDRVREVVGPALRPTVVFDRGGYSPKLFKLVTGRGFDLITYRKGKCRAFGRKDFTKQMVRRGQREVETPVRDGRIRLPGFGLIRCVAVLRPDDRQTHVLTTRTDLSAREVLERMFGRWQQENLFKYLRESFALDALWTHDLVGGDPTRTVPNPEHGRLTRQIAELRHELAQRKTRLGEIACQAHPLDSTQLALDLPEQVGAAADIALVENKIEALRERRRKVPKRVAVASLRAEKVEELARAPQLLCDVIKMAAYHVETALVAAAAPYLKRATQEGRAFIAATMQLDGRITPRHDHVLITLNRPSAPRYVRALEGLCQYVTDLKPSFPETATPLRFEVLPDPASPDLAS